MIKQTIAAFALVALAGIPAAYAQDAKAPAKGAAKGAAAAAPAAPAPVITVAEPTQPRTPTEGA